MALSPPLSNSPDLPPETHVDALTTIWFAQYGPVGKYADQEGLIYQCLLANHEWDASVAAHTSSNNTGTTPNEDEYLYNQMHAISTGAIPDDPDDGAYTAWRASDAGRCARYAFARRFVEPWDEMDNLNDTAVEDVRELVLHDDEAMILLDRRLEMQLDKIMTMEIVDRLAEMYGVGRGMIWEKEEEEEEEESESESEEDEGGCCARLRWVWVC
jgi:hypothetical protein